ncbi:MAG: hypothetical protein K6253_01755 [Candidatus Liberibacter asiaticus]|nr:hypothetical protein [Candidatus Liberibacter asiaticus]
MSHSYFFIICYSHVMLSIYLCYLSIPQFIWFLFSSQLFYSNLFFSFFFFFFCFVFVFAI